MSRGLPAFPKKKRGKHFVIRITLPDGSRPWLTLGETREEAYLRYADYIKQIKSQKSGHPSYRAMIKQGIEAYLEIKKSQFGSPSSYVRYCNVMDNFKDFLGVKYPGLVHLDEIQARHISEFLDYRLKEKDRHPGTVNFERDTISNMFKVLINEKNLPLTNPVDKVGHKDEPDPDDFYYKEDEVIKILETAKQFSKRIDWHAVFVVFFNTGMRRNELRYLTWEDIDFEEKVIYIRPKQITQSEKFRVKNRRPRLIPILPEVEAALKTLAKRSDRWVFTNSRGKTFSNDIIRQQFRKICKAAGLPIKKLHQTRHSWTSIAYQKGVPEPAIQAAGGWADAKTMRRYNHSGQNKEFVIEAFKKNFSIGRKDK